MYRYLQAVALFFEDRKNYRTINSVSYFRTVLKDRDRIFEKAREDQLPNEEKDRIHSLRHLHD